MCLGVAHVLQFRKSDTERVTEVGGTVCRIGLHVTRGGQRQVGEEVWHRELC